MDFAVQEDHLAIITNTHLWHANLTTKALKRAALGTRPIAVAVADEQVLVLSASAILRFRFSPYSVTEIRLKLSNPTGIASLSEKQFLVSEGNGVVVINGTEETHHKFDQPKIHLDGKIIYISSGTRVYRLDPPWTNPVLTQNLECSVTDLAFSQQTMFLICPSLVSRFDRSGQLIQKIRVLGNHTVREMALMNNAHYYLFSDNRIEIYQTTRQSTRLWRPQKASSKITGLQPSKAGLLFLNSGKISRLPNNKHTNS